MREIERRTAHLLVPLDRDEPLPFPPKLFAQVSKMFERGRPEMEKLLAALRNAIADTGEASSVALYLMNKYAYGGAAGVTRALDGVDLAELIDAATARREILEGASDGKESDYGDELGDYLEDEDEPPPPGPLAA